MSGHTLETVWCVKQANYNLTPPMGKGRTPSAPWQMLAIDFIGPFPRSVNGNRWILTIVDCFSKYTIVQTCRDATAAILNKTLEEKIFLVHGAPQIIICDNGSQFKSNMFKELCEKFQIAIWFTPFYHAQANPSEAVNKIIGNAIRCYIIDEPHKNWDKNLCYIASAINSSVHTVTQSSPFEMLFGRKFAITGRHAALMNDGSGVNHLKEIEKICENVSKRLESSYEKSKKRYDLRSRNISFAVGDIVYRRNNKLSDKSAGYSAKLAPQYVRAVVIKRIGTHVYQVRDENQNVVGNYHCKNLKQSNFENEENSPAKDS